MKTNKQILAEIKAFKKKIEPELKVIGVQTPEDGICTVEVEPSSQQDHKVATANGISRFLKRNHQTLGLRKRSR